MSSNNIVRRYIRTILAEEWALIDKESDYDKIQAGIAHNYLIKIGRVYDSYIKDLSVLTQHTILRQSVKTDK